LLLRFRRQLPCIVSCHTRYINYSSQNCPTFQHLMRRVIIHRCYATAFNES
jgi:hypothetical protein